MKTLVLGASPNPTRYAYLAVQRLLRHGHEVVAVGLRKGEIEGVPIRTDWPEVSDVDTITMYVGPDRQQPLYDYILRLNARRVIFNPGTENQELAALLKSRGTEVDYACTLVMLASDQY